MKKSKASWTLFLSLAVGLALLQGCQQPSSPDEGTEGSGMSESGEAAGAAQHTPAAGGNSPSAANPQTSRAAASAPRQATLPAGTRLQVRTMNTLSTKVVKSGESFSASLEEPLVEGNWVIAPKGATVLGTIVNSDPGGKVKGRASLAVRLTQLQTADGQQIAISTDTYGVQAKASKQEDAKKIGIGAGVGAAIGAIAGGGSGAAKGAGVGAGAGTGMVLATRGDPAVIPSESVLSFQLVDSVTVTGKK